MINSFRGKYFFLSNFYELPIAYNGISYLNNESAFQAQKTLDDEVRKKFSNLNPSDAKRMGRHVKLRTDWEQIKDQIMYEIVKKKFTPSSCSYLNLLATGNEQLEEGNTWGDKEWGTVNSIGKNKLGKILMRVREELK